MPQFAPVTPDVVAELEEIVGAKYVIHSEPDLSVYGRDETEDLQYAAEVAVRPDATDQVARIMKLAHDRGICVTPRGAGTGLSGGALPVFGGIVLCVDRMNRILELDEDNLVVRVQPGVITGVLQDTVAEKGLYYPPDPASHGSCMIGGNIAENAGGPHCVKYGLTKDYVLSLEAVMPNGDVFRTGGKLKKDVAGYNLTQLLVGSEGTLAVVTEATLRLIPMPTVKRTILAPFDSLDTAAKGIVAVYQSRIIPAALELVEKAALEAAEEHLGRKVPYGDAEAQILLELDGYDEEAVDRDLMRAGEVLLEAGALDAMLADTPAKTTELWTVRKCLGEAVKKQAAYIECDTAVPPDKVPDLLRGVRKVAAEYGIQQISYGHAGDGNIHVNVLTDSPDLEERERQLRPAVKAILQVSVDLGGTITGEHGVGCAQSRYLHMCRDDIALAAMRSIKDAFDPKGILNPGKVLPAEVPPPVAAGSVAQA
ncbi:MAG: FAD-linked oxidase C-terminal domain-containing protein [Planctomycetota bacterium]|nr:FAD-linked oxidase C-terminal domain-containing protein [Planctomycetota bacterium]